MTNFINAKETLRATNAEPAKKRNIKATDVFSQCVVRLIAILNVADRRIAIQIMAYRLNSM